MKQAHVIITGTVQGVGYRYFVRSNAENLGLKGWVRNTSNGKVEAVLQGTEEQVQEMLALARQGPILSEVKDIEVEWEGVEGEFSDFEIKKD
jgi:acylphosphatase